MMSTSEPLVHASAISRIGHAEAMRLTETENARILALLERLRDDDWTRPTDCARWTVRDVVVHVIASAQGQGSLRELVRQVRAGRPLTAQIGGVHWVDGLNEAQLRARTDWQPAQLPDRWAQASAAALRARRRMPAPVRALPILPIGKGPGVDLGWKPLAYLFDIGFTRDAWMHRVDICCAVGTPMELTAEHDGRIVADILAEWSQLHGHAFTLQLEGPAGGRFTAGGGAPTVSVDAIEFVRTLSGRAEHDGVLRNKLPL